MRPFIVAPIRRAVVTLLFVAALGGCTLAPRNWQEEKRRLAAAGQTFEVPPPRRPLPDIPPEPDWQDILRRALLANGDLEAAYFEWKAALERVGVAGAYPNTNVALSYDYLFSGGNLKAWDRSTFNVGFDPMQNLSFPTKVWAAGQVALDDARAAARRFEAAKFALQERVLTAYFDYALLGEKLRLQQDQATLLRMAVESASFRTQTGAPQQELVDAEVQLHRAENELRNLEAEVIPGRAALNALSGRTSEAPLPLPSQLPPTRPLAADDAELLILGANNNPELAALAQQTLGREDALELARQQYLPDINPFAGFTGSIEQFAGAMIILPTTWPRIASAVKEARATLRQNEALLRQARLDRAAAFVAALYAMRNNERQATFLEHQIIPATELTLTNTRQRYTTGVAGLSDVIGGQQGLLELRLAVAEARTAREKRLAELEALMGVDVETLQNVPPVVASRSTEDVR